MLAAPVRYGLRHDLACSTTFNKEMMDTMTGWRRVEAGHYASGPWSARRLRKNEWWLFEEGRLRGDWRSMGNWKSYRPFKTLKDAKLAVERACGAIPHGLAC